MPGSRTSPRSWESRFATPTPRSPIRRTRTASGEPLTASIPMSPDTGRWGSRSLERSRNISDGPFRGRRPARKDQMVFGLCGPFVDRAARAHLLGFVVVLAVALLLHYGLLP